MKPKKESHLKRLITGSVIWFITASFFMEYVISRPNPRWMFFSGVAILGVFSAYLISQTFKYFDFLLMASDNSQSSKEKSDIKKENENQKQNQ